ncbi:hypothetical protein TSMEX_011835 [Taenia solium]|eukprot:TsM_000123700 transcript=TsM_000123700 gene=TsM_000123700
MFIYCAEHSFRRSSRILPAVPGATLVGCLDVCRWAEHLCRVESCYGRRLSAEYGVVNCEEGGSICGEFWLGNSACMFGCDIATDVGSTVFRNISAAFGTYLEMVSIALEFRGGHQNWMN